MNTARSLGWLSLALILLAGFGWYYASASPPTKLDEQALATTTDTVITELTVQQFDAHGQLAHYLHTPLMKHIPENNTHQLKTPHILVTQLNQSPWEIHAEEATALRGGQEITLKHQVVISQKQAAQTSVLKTDEMTYYPQDQFATTPKEVLFLQAGSQVRSTGMHAYLAENRVQLLSNARGIYDSNHG